jgi:hypothetical protein
VAVRSPSGGPYYWHETKCQQLSPIRFDCGSVYALENNRDKRHFNLVLVDASLEAVAEIEAYLQLKNPVGTVALPVGARELSIVHDLRLLPQ